MAAKEKLSAKDESARCDYVHFVLLILWAFQRDESRGSIHVTDTLVTFLAEVILLQGDDDTRRVNCTAINAICSIHVFFCWGNQQS